MIKFNKETKLLTFFGGEVGIVGIVYSFGQIRLQPKFYLPSPSGSALQVCGAGGYVC